MRDDISTRIIRTAKAPLAFLAVVACVLALAVPAGAVELHQGWWLQIRNAACAQGPKVLLGDIALPRGEIAPAACYSPGRSSSSARPRLALTCKLA